MCWSQSRYNTVYSHNTSLLSLKICDKFSLLINSLQHYFLKYPSSISESRKIFIMLHLHSESEGNELVKHPRTVKGWWMTAHTTIFTSKKALSEGMNMEINKKSSLICVFPHWQLYYCITCWFGFWRDSLRFFNFLGGA